MKQRERTKQGNEEEEEEEKKGEEEEGRDKGGRAREGSSYRLMVCSRIGLVDHRLNWVSVQSPANTSSTATSGPWLGGERETELFSKREIILQPLFFN